MQSANLSGPFRGCLYYALLGLPQATGLAGGYDLRAGGVVGVSQHLNKVCLLFFPVLYLTGAERGYIIVKPAI